MTSPTPGPWGWENGGYECDGLCSTSGCPGHDNGIPESLYPVGLWIEEPPEPFEQWKADARLIAAAPDLLEVCEACLPILEETMEYMEWHGGAEVKQQLEAAIAKARDTEESQ